VSSEGRGFVYRGAVRLPCCVRAVPARQQQSEVEKRNAALVLAALAVIAAVVVAFVG
jgi:hypothetical protein